MYSFMIIIFNKLQVREGIIKISTFTFILFISWPAAIKLYFKLSFSVYSRLTHSHYLIYIHNFMT